MHSLPISSPAAASGILLVGEYKPVLDRLAALLNATESVIRVGRVKDAEKWLIGGHAVSLIIADEHSAYSMVHMSQRYAGSQFVPVLMACQNPQSHLTAIARNARVVDVLDVTAEDRFLRATVRYYAELNRRVLSAAAPEPAPGAYGFALPIWKRTLDIAISLSALIVLLPVLLLVALLIRLDSKGPVLYKSKRAGANFLVFNMYKYRTMKVRADQLIQDLRPHNIYANPMVGVAPTADGGADGRCSTCRQQGVACQQLLFDQTHHVCEKVYLRETEGMAKFMKFRNDPRITRLGRFLRNSSIDELPQLLNVLRGDMSLVGNRPLPLYEAEKLTTNESARRFASPAGLTGLWQVKKRAKGQAAPSDRERIALDIEYARTFSFKTDAHLLWQTCFSVWQKENV